MQTSLQQLHKGTKALSIAVTEAQYALLQAYIDLLAKWNRAYNLIGPHTVDTIVTTHILDSLAVAPMLASSTIQTVLDVGTGAGLPGIPLAILFPNKKFTLLDSNGKKTRFLTQVKAELALANVVIVQERVENYRTTPLFNVIISRAVGTAADLIKQSQHLLAQQGQWMLMKAQQPEAETQSVRHPVTIKALNVPGLAAKRHLVIIEGESA